MKIAVFGPGAMGSIFAAKFAQAGHSVTLIASRRPAAKAGLQMPAMKRLCSYILSEVRKQ